MSDYGSDEDTNQNISDEENELDTDDEDEDDIEINALNSNLEEVFGESSALVEGSDDEDIEEDIYNVSHFKKKDEYIAELHPELLTVNFQELKSCSQVIYNEKGQIDDPLHRSIPILTKYEFTRLVGIRSKQINDGAKPFIEVDPSIIDGYTIALMEIRQKKFPCYIKRPKPNGKTEFWKLQDLEILNY